MITLFYIVGPMGPTYLLHVVHSILLRCMIWAVFEGFEFSTAHSMMFNVAFRIIRHAAKFV